MGRNAHKNTWPVAQLPFQADPQNRRFPECGKPFFVLADTSDSSGYKNDVRGVYLKRALNTDTIDFYVELNGVQLTPLGSPVYFPNDPLVAGFVVDWRQHLIATGPGCYRIKVEANLAGLAVDYYEGSYNVQPWSIDRAMGTVRLYSKFDSYNREKDINFKESGFIDSIRFNGFFGKMQPNTEVNNLIGVNRELRKVTRRNDKTYELQSDPLNICHTKRIIDDHLIDENLILVCDHNAHNHSYEYRDLGCIVDEVGEVNYNEGRGAVVNATFKDKYALNKSMFINGMMNGITPAPPIPTCDPAMWTLEDSVGNTLDSGSIVSGGSETITAPDTDLEINGTPEGSFTAGSTIDLQLTDGVNPVTPVSVGRVGDTVTVEVPAASTGWVRNPDWLPLPEITAADNRFVGLFLVFENEYNQLTVNATNNAASIDWGDSTSVTSNGTTQTKVYDYSSLPGAVKQYYDGRNYKQVIVDITRLNTLTSLILSNNSLSALNNNGTINFVDILASLPETTTFVSGTSNSRTLRICERFVLLTSVDTTYSTAFFSLPMLQYLDIPLNHLNINTAVANILQRSGGNLKFFNNSNLDIDSPVFRQMFELSYIKRVGNLTSSASTSGGFSNVFQNSTIEQVGNITLTNATDLSNFFYQAYNLHTIGVINAPNSTGINAMFNNCNSLKEIVFTDCSNIVSVSTGSNGSFFQCYSLSKLIMPGMRIGFVISGCNLTAQALNDLFNSLGTASGSQTIIVTNNPGAATCDTTIATAKGFAVTI